MIVENFYNLKSLPFQKSITTENIFQNDTILELEKRLEYIKEKRGIMLLTGLPGTGKTLSIRTFIDKLNQNLYKVFYIPLSTVSTLDFYNQLAFYLTGESFWKKSQLFKAIQSGIRDSVTNNKIVPIIIFDEAHFLKNENFYELQIISNFDIDSLDPCLFIIIGQPHIRDRLARPIHKSFNQRIGIRFHLSPLSHEDTNLYVKYHLSLVGRKEPIFNENAIYALHQNSNGICRVINQLALNSLVIGATEKKEILTEEDVYRASKEV